MPLDGFGIVLVSLIHVTLQSGYAANDVKRELKTVDIVEHTHVEGCGGGAFFFVSAHMNVAVIPAPVGQLMNQHGVAVEGEDHRLVGGEERIEVFVGDSMRMFNLRLQGHQVDHVDHADSNVRNLLAEDGDGGKSLERRHIAAAGHYHIGI